MTAPNDAAHGPAEKAEGLTLGRYFVDCQETNANGQPLRPRALLPRKAPRADGVFREVRG